MRLLFLGPPCERIETALHAQGHSVVRCEEALTISYLEENKFYFGISYRYTKILSGDMIKWFSGRLINLHISFLPWNRGADPNLWSFLTQTPSGVAIHLIDEGIDTGALLIREQVAHDLHQDTLRSTYSRLESRIIDLFLENADDIFNEKIPVFKPEEIGSYHSSKDKGPFLHLLAVHGWDTKISQLAGKGV